MSQPPFALSQPRLTAKEQRPDGATILTVTFGRDPAVSCRIDARDFTPLWRIGYHRWGWRPGRVVASMPGQGGMTNVARMIMELPRHLVPAYRDGKYLDLTRENLGFTSKDTGSTWWLVLRPNEFDAEYHGVTPRALIPWRKPRLVWHREHRGAA